MTRILGNLGTWLCDHFTPRRATKAEAAQCSQYAGLMVDVLRGECHDYGRDRDKDHVPIVAERKDYDAIYGRAAGQAERGQ